jgi:hypothetical protein
MKHKILHKPSGETWLALHIDGSAVYCAGWPPTIARLTDCEIIEDLGELDEQEKNHLLSAFGVDVFEPKEEESQEELWNEAIGKALSDGFYSWGQLKNYYRIERISPPIKD